MRPNGIINQNVNFLNNASLIRSTLQQYHPLIIEGHSRDERDASLVANRIIFNLKNRWEEKRQTKSPEDKPVLLITQGDPLTERGISAITRHVSNSLGIKRCLVSLDDHIDPGHSLNADREDVIYEVKYSQLVSILMNDDAENNDNSESVMERLTHAIDSEIGKKNERRFELGKDPLADWYKDYALLQEVTKSALKSVSGNITLAHTSADIADFSVTSFYTVGLDLGLIDREDILSYF